MTTPMNDHELSTLIREQATRHRASPRLRADIKARIVLANANANASPNAAASASTGQEASGWLQALFGLWTSPTWRHAGLGMACGVLLTLAVGLLFNQLRLGEPSAHQLVAAHVQALRNGPLYVVASSDRHTVKPWFAGKLDFAPPVPDLGAAGFALLGGRVDHLGEGTGGETAVLIYTHNQHTITVFIRPGRVVKDAVAATDNGFHLLSWTSGDMKVTVVSDMDSAEVNAFRAAWMKSL